MFVCFIWLFYSQILSVCPFPYVPRLFMGCRLTLTGTSRHSTVRLTEHEAIARTRGKDIKTRQRQRGDDDNKVDGEAQEVAFLLWEGRERCVS